MAQSYRSDDLTRWGTGLGRNLTAAEADRNVWDLAQGLLDLETSRPTPNEIESVQLVGTALSFTMQDGTVFGPFTLPTLMFKWRISWEAFTVYAPLDTFVVAGLGIYTVLLAHTS